MGVSPYLGHAASNATHREASRRRLGIITYKVVPFSPRGGLIEFVQVSGLSQSVQVRGLSEFVQVRGPTVRLPGADLVSASSLRGLTEFVQVRGLSQSSV